MTSAILTARGIRLGCTANSREEAVHLCGELLNEIGAVERPYIDAMWERENLMSSFIGESTAIPHGTDESRKYVNFAQLVLLRFAEPIDWEGDLVSLAIGIASANDDHVETLGTLAELLMDEPRRKQLFTSDNPDEIVDLLEKAFHTS